MFTKSELDDIHKIDDIKALMETQQRLGGNPSGTAGNLMAAGGLVGAGMLLPKVGGFVFANPITAASMLLTPDIVSRLYTSEAARKLLIKGLDPRFAANTEIATNLVAAITRATLEKNSDERVNSGKPPLKLK